MHTHVSIVPRFQRSHCLDDRHACLAVRSLRLPDNAFKQSQDSLVLCRYCFPWVLVARERRILICTAIKANCRPTFRSSTDRVIITSNMNPNSHDEIHATGDQVPTQIHDAINQAEQTTDESLDWPEEVFKSVSVPAPGSQRQTVSGTSY